MTNLNDQVNLAAIRATRPDFSTYNRLVGSLDGDQRNAAQAVLTLFAQYGLESLAGKVIDFAKSGYSSDTITLMLQETPEYKKRFSANDERIKKGLAPLSPSEYLATERAYRQVMQSSGLPAGFYDSTDDFKGFIAADVAPQEVQQRIKTATDFVNSVPQEVRNQFNEWYTTGDMIAYALDPAKATALVEKSMSAANIAGRGDQYGLNISQAAAERAASLGLSQEQISQMMAAIGNDAQNTMKLAAMDGSVITADQMVNEAFGGDGTVTQKRQRLASQERARFSGSSGVGGNSLGKSTSGQL